jgi:hypothetical protein
MAPEIQREPDAPATRLRGSEHAAMGIVATGVESIFNEPPLSYRSTKSVNLSLVQRNPDISLHYTQHQIERMVWSIPQFYCTPHLKKK